MTNGLVTFIECSEQGDIGQANYCLSKAITSDPEDIQLRFHRAALYLELGDYQKAAESYEQIHQLCLENIEALKTGAKVYHFSIQLSAFLNILHVLYYRLAKEKKLLGMCSSYFLGS